MIEFLISLVAPHVCLGCGHEGSLLCPECIGDLRPAIDRCYRCNKITDHGKTCPNCRSQTKLSRVRALTLYERNAKDLVWRLKFQRAKSGAAEIGRMLAPLFIDEYGQIKSSLLLVHVPTASSRIRRRGYDQAALITKSLSRESAVRRASLLRRAGQQRQVGGSREKRREQISHAFRARNADQIKGAHIILIDDVVTTGATLEAAAATLKAAGAKRVEALVFAQA